MTPKQIQKNIARSYQELEHFVAPCAIEDVQDIIADIVALEIELEKECNK